MELIFVVNLAVSAVLSVGLWLVWRSDTEQRFARSMAWAIFFNGLSGLAYLLWKNPSPVWHELGSVLLPATVAAIFMHVFEGVIALRGWRPHKGYLALSGGLVFLTYLTLIELRLYSIVGYLNSALWLGSGLASIRILWSGGWLVRGVALLILGIGLNSLLIGMYGDEGMAPMYANGMVLRVALGITLMAAAMVRTQQKANQSTLRYQSLSQYAPMGIVVAGESGILYANSAAARLAGYANERDMLADDFYALLPEPVRPGAREKLRELLSGERELVHTFSHLTNKQGQALYLQVSAWRIRWDDVNAVQIVVQDETQKYQAEQEVKHLQERYERQRVEFAERSKNALLRTNAELEVRVAERTRQLQEASLAKSQFLSSMSHEIRTPMNVVLGLLQLLYASPQNHVQADYTYKAMRAAKSLLSLLNDLLDFSKMDAGKMELELAPFSLERMLRDFSNLVPPMVGSKPLEVLFEIDPTVPEAFVGDAMRIQQVLMNLVSNAIKFTADGEVIVQVHVCHRTMHEARLRISVRDTGIGIAPDRQAEIFEAFSSSHSPVSRPYGGSGLGLPICKKLLGLMHSDLLLISELDKGSCFYFELTLPLAENHYGLKPEVANSTFDQPLYVLVVDDNETARVQMVGMGQRLGWNVEACEGGRQACNRIRELSGADMPLFDAVVVDWRMPDMDGWETLRNIRALYPVDQPPLCVMASAHGRDVLAQRSAQDQALLSAYMTKPLTLAMLSEAVSGARKGQGNVRNGPRPKTPKGIRLRGLRLLMVEDNPFNQLVARELLVAEGAHVTTADNGALGVACLAENPGGFDAVLMDMQMPVMDGCTATVEIRKRLGLVSLPVIAMTANTMQSDKDACKAAGMNDHVGKPFDIHYLVGVIRKHCGLPAFGLGGKEAGSASHEPDFDVDSAIAALDGDHELYNNIVEVFLKELELLPKLVADQINDGERTAAKRTLHTLKGTAATVGALALSRAAREAEAKLSPDALPQEDDQVVRAVEEAVRQAMLAMSKPVE